MSKIAAKIAPPMTKAVAKNVNAGAKTKKAGKVDPPAKITSTQQIVDYRKKKYGV